MSPGYAVDAGLCLTYRGAMAEERAGLSILLDAAWKLRKSADKPWLGWSADTDDDPKSLVATVNFGTFIELLQEHLLAAAHEGGEVRQPLLRLDYLH